MIIFLIDNLNDMYLGLIQPATKFYVWFVLL